MAEGAVLYAHDGQLAAERQLERQTVQVRVVVQVQVLQVLQSTCGLERNKKGCKRVVYRLVWPCVRAAVSSYRSPPVGAAAGSLPSPGTSGW